MSFVSHGRGQVSALGHPQGSRLTEAQQLCGGPQFTAMAGGEEGESCTDSSSAA